MQRPPRPSLPLLRLPALPLAGRGLPSTPYAPGHAMAPTASSAPPGPLLPSRARRHLLVRPAAPTYEDLGQPWTLSEADTREVLRCRGAAKRRRFAWHLCARRTYGRFVPQQAVVPVRLLTDRGRQL